MMSMISKKRRCVGWILQILTAAVLLLDAGTHLLNPAFVAQGFQQAGLGPMVAPVIGAIELIFLALYLVPRTALIGAVLFTGFLGGAVAINVHVGGPLLTLVFLPIYVAIVMWGSLFLRDPRVRGMWAGPAR